MKECIAAVILISGLICGGYALFQMQNECSNKGGIYIRQIIGFRCVVLAPGMVQQ